MERLPNTFIMVRVGFNPTPTIVGLVMCINAFAIQAVVAYGV